MKLHDILDGAAKFNASDVHLTENYPPYLRVDGRLKPVQAPPLDGETIDQYARGMMPTQMNERFEKNMAADFAYSYNKELRYRVSVYRERNRLKIVMRAIPMKIPTAEELELPAPLMRIAVMERGMVLVTGATGSGKSTSLAAMIQHANATQNRCVITIEDPIEYVYENQKSIITQREVGVDVPNFHLGLVQSLRQDPDVILIGEMRDADAMRVALTSAETGHLVYSTLHTTNAVQTIERMISTFPEEERDLVREELAYNLKAAISQRLMRRAGGKGRIAAFEIMIVNATISKLIYENRIRDIPGVVAGREEDMMNFDQSLAELVREERIDQAEAERYCDDLYAFRRYVKGGKSTGESGGIIAGF